MTIEGLAEWEEAEAQKRRDDFDRNEAKMLEHIRQEKAKQEAGIGVETDEDRAMAEAEEDDETDSDEEFP